MTARAGLEELAGRFHAAYNEHAVQAAAALYAEHGRHVDVPQAHVATGVAAIRDGLARFLGWFPDAHWEPSRPIAGDGVVTVAYRLSGTLQSRLGPFEPRGQRLDLAGVHVLVAPEGAIVESVDVWHRPTLEAQLGGAP